jgi:CheY-like chemotaxis protein
MHIPPASSAQSLDHTSMRTLDHNGQNVQTIGRRAARVLLVEDSAAQALLVQRAVADVDTLELLHIARDGEEALAFLRGAESCHGEQIPDLILLDLNLPKRSGLDVLSEVRRDERLRTIPVVMLTTSEQDEDVVESYKRGANTFYNKPPSLAGLKALLHDCGRYWAAARLAPV